MFFLNYTDQYMYKRATKKLWGWEFGGVTLLVSCLNLVLFTE